MIYSVFLSWDIISVSVDILYYFFVMSYREVWWGVQQPAGCKSKYDGVHEAGHSCPLPLSTQHQDHAHPHRGQGGLDHHAKQDRTLHAYVFRPEYSGLYTLNSRFKLQVLPTLLIASQDFSSVTEATLAHVTPAVINKESQICFPIGTAGVCVGWSVLAASYNQFFLNPIEIEQFFCFWD